jgi:hypothetical protein
VIGLMLTFCFMRGVARRPLQVRRWPRGTPVHALVKQYLAA